MQDPVEEFGQFVGACGERIGLGFIGLAGEQGDQQLLDDLILTDDHLAQFRPDVVVPGFERFHGRQVARCFRIL